MQWSLAGRIVRPLILVSFLLATTSAHALSIGATTEALGISWTLSATDEVDAMYAADWDIMFSLTAEIPTDLDLLMDEGETITPLWITTAEARVAGLTDFQLVEAPNGVGGWEDLAGPSANGCQNVSGGSACAEAKSDADAADIVAGATYEWVWVGDVSDLEAVFADDMSGLKHVGAHLENERHRNGWNVSEEFQNPVPEPSAALVFGAGIVVAALRIRRRELRVG
jgi:hypothetical protein